MPNKGFALVAAGQFETRLQELGLRGSYLDGSRQAMPSITTFLISAPSISGVSQTFLSEFMEVRSEKQMASPNVYTQQFY